VPPALPTPPVGRPDPTPRAVPTITDSAAAAHHVASASAAAGAGTADPGPLGHSDGASAGRGGDAASGESAPALPLPLPAARAPWAGVGTPGTGSSGFDLQQQFATLLAAAALAAVLSRRFAMPATLPVPQPPTLLLERPG
jgi:hypothetical protein